MAVKRILIVDDEPDIVETVKFSLELEGYHCLVSYDGLEAIEKVHQEMPDLIILDVRLPKKNGYQVCRLLKFDEKYKHIPILLLTARAQQSDRLIGKQTGADEYITKPFEMDELVRSVKRYLEKS